MMDKRQVGFLLVLALLAGGVLGLTTVIIGLFLVLGLRVGAEQLAADRKRLKERREP